MKRYIPHFILILLCCLASVVVCDRYNRGSYEPIGRWLVSFVSQWVTK